MVSKHQLSKHPDYVNAIGMIALEVVDLELELSILFSRVLMVKPKIGECIYMTPKGDRARLDILQNAAEVVFATKAKGKTAPAAAKRKIDARDKVKLIVKRCRDSIDQRHRIIHDDWYISPETQEIKRAIVDGRLDVDATSKSVTLAELNAALTKLRKLIDDVSKLSEEFRKEPPQMMSMKI